jgi:hypothetical protein
LVYKPPAPSVPIKITAPSAKVSAQQAHGGAQSLEGQVAHDVTVAPNEGFIPVTRKKKKGRPKPTPMPTPKCLWQPRTSKAGPSKVVTFQEEAQPVSDKGKATVQATVPVANVFNALNDTLGLHDLIDEGDDPSLPMDLFSKWSLALKGYFYFSLQAKWS